MIKLLRIIVIIIVVLLILAAAAIHIVIEHTDLPREITEKSLSEKLQTPVSIKDLKTNWLGKSKLKDVRIQVPDDELSFVDIKSLQVQHNNPGRLLVTRDIGIDTAKAENVTANLYPKKKKGALARVFPIENIELKFYSNKSENDRTSVLQMYIAQPDIGDVKAIALIEDDQINLNIVDGTLFGGEFSGKMAAYTDQWEKTMINLSWKDVDLRELQKWVPEVEGMLNLSSGQLDVKPSVLEHPLEPLEYDIKMAMKDDSVLTGFDIDQLEMSGFVGRERLLLTDFSVPVFGGEFKTNARVSKKSDGFFLYARNEFEQLDIKKISDTFSEKKDAEVEGKLQGTATVMTSFKIQDLSGTMDLKLTESNLAGSQFMQAITNVLNLRFGKTEPVGRGNTQISFQGGKVNISDFYYYNRGIEIRGTALVDDLLKGGESPVEGVVMASARPLKEVKLPGTSTLDKYMFLIQQDMTAVKLDGTVANVEVKVIALPEVKATLKKLLGSN